MLEAHPTILERSEDEELIDYENRISKLLTEDTERWFHIGVCYTSTIQKKTLETNLENIVKKGDPVFVLEIY